MLHRSETELDFYSRRAMEEAHAAAAAASVVVGATHRHMAAAYAAKLRDEQEVTAVFEELLGELGEVEATTSAGNGETSCDRAPTPPD